MSAPPLFQVAKMGDRFSHDAAMATRSQPLVAALVGQAITACGQAGALCAQVGAAASSAVSGVLSVIELLPRTAMGVIEAVSPTVQVAPGLGAALAGAAAVQCTVHRAVSIAPGLGNVLVQGFPLALAGGQTGCGALLCDGVPTVLVGGAPSTGAGCGTTGGSPVADAIALAESIAGRIEPAIAAVQRGADLVEQTVTDTMTTVSGAVSAVSGAISAVTGALTSLTSGGALGALGALAGAALLPES